MGCDFYTYYVVRIEYKDGYNVITKSDIVESTRQRHYYWEMDERDEDFEEWTDYVERSCIHKQTQIDTELKRYKKVDIYKNKQWLCLVSAVEKYKNLCKELNINENDVISIWKEGGFHCR